MVESESSKFKLKITGKVSADGNTKDIKITVSLKYCVIASAAEETKFALTDTKIVTLSTQHSTKLLQQLKPGTNIKGTLLKEQLIETNINQK